MANPLSRTTHTVEIAQIEELNARLAERRSQGRDITAAELGLAGDTVLAGRAARGVLSPTAVLTAIGWDGDPEFPYLHGRFSDSAASSAEPGLEPPRVDLHSPALQELARRLGLSQAWGSGPRTDHR